MVGAIGLFLHLCCTPSLGSSQDTSIDGPSRMLDDACRTGGCVVEKSAALVSGVTSDSYAIRIGPGEGSAQVTFTLGDALADGFSWHLELLASGNGSFKVETPPCGQPLVLPNQGENAPGSQPLQQTLTPTAGYEWISLSPVCGSGRSTAPVTFSIATATDDALIDIADVRIKADMGSGYCSIARVGDRRRR
ncbi:MAG TPA: hypothetical protein VGL13_10620 [Polyangiaceae bacterium]